MRTQAKKKTQLVRIQKGELNAFERGTVKNR